MNFLPKAPLPNLVKLIESTYDSNVMSRVGDYAGLFNTGNGQLLVTSADGVGTKIVVACQEAMETGDLRVHEGIGVDLVNHSINDILVYGAEPLFFLNYFGYSAEAAKDIQIHVMQGMVRAANAVCMPIISGETSRMEGFYPYPDRAYEVVGTIVGTVARDQCITGETIGPGDCMIALGSDGLHTNGFTTLRRAFTGPDASLASRQKWVKTRREVLTPHRSYLYPFVAMKDRFQIKGIAHITGGGIEANLRRIVKRPYEMNWSWSWPAIFSDIQEAGKIDLDTMRSEFNLGVGMIWVVDANSAEQILAALHNIGEVAFTIGVVV